MSGEDSEDKYPGGGSGREDRFLSLQARYGSEVITVLGSSDSVLYESGSVEKLLGYNHAEEVSPEGDWFRHVHPEDAEKLANAVEGCVATPGESPPVEYRIRHADGGWRWLESHGVNLLDDPEVGGVVVSTREVTDRKRAEEARQESEARLESAFENAPMGVAILDLDERLVAANTELCEMLGYLREELVGKSSFEITHPDDRAESEARGARLLSGERGEEGLEKRYLRKDGASLWARCDARLVRDAEGDPESFVCHVQDISSRRRAEEALRESEERYRLLVEQVPALTYSASLDDPNFAASYVSPQARRMLGYSPEEWLSSPGFWVERLHPHDRAGVLEKARRVRESGADPSPVEYRMVAKDGREVWFRDEARVVEDSEGSRLLRGVMVDITERRRTEEWLGLMERAVADANDAVLITEGRPFEEPGPRIVHANPAFRRMSGYTAEEVLGETPRILQGPKTDRGELDRIRAALEAWRPVRAEVVNHRKDGSEFWVELHISPVTDEGGRVTHWVSVQRETTERRGMEEEARLKDRAVASSSNGIIITDPNLPDNPIIYVNPTFERITGYTAEEARGRNCRFLRDPEEEQPKLDELRRAVTDGGEWSGALRNYRKDGSTFWNELYIAPVYDDGGTLTNFVGIQEDITERVRVEEALRESERRFRSVVQSSSEVIKICDADGTLRYASPAFKSLFGHDPDGAVRSGMNVNELVHPEDLPRVLAATERGMARGGGSTGRAEYRFRCADGSYRRVESVATFLLEDPAVEGVLINVRDVTERKELEEELEYRAFHDPLTGLANRRLFTERLEQALSRAGRTGKEVAVLFVDLDNFKVINDTLGHDAGDELLAAMGARLDGCLRPEDTISRFGGDEFTVLLEDLGRGEPQEAVRVAERVRESLRQPFSVATGGDFAGGREIFVAASVGIAKGGPDSVPGGPAEFLKRADMAMYRAKAGGRDAYAVFEEEMSARARERLELESALRRAIDSPPGSARHGSEGMGEFILYYQPTVHLQSGRITGVEALLRWERPGRGLVLPGSFIPLAEELGLTVPLGLRTLAEACRQGKEWHGRQAANVGPRGGGRLTVNVNLSARQLSEASLAGDVRAILKQSGFDPRCLCLEITEEALLEAPLTATRRLEEIKALGVRLALDDFGTGQSSLSRLGSLPVDVVKMDLAIVSGVDKEETNAALVSATVALARSLGLRVVAEGVETEGQMRKLRSLGCDMGQGYYFSEALPAVWASRLLDS